MSCFSFLFRRKKNSRHSSINSEDEVAGTQNVRIFTYTELRNATEDFSPANKIGEGGFGSVYRGRLRDGTVAAIKVLSSDSTQGVHEFLSELETIANINHENLVRLNGCCVEGNNRILIYEFLENNSLARTLLGRGHSNIQFDWIARTKICIGVARGLSFLHEEICPHIVHRDIKASNILLDKYLNPKISDFGLAKLLPSNVTHVSTRVAGTIGYLAPEYAVSGRLTRKADMYSFGVLLLEIITGRSNTNTRLPADDQLLEKIWDLNERNELKLIVDPALHGEFDADEACRFLKVGLLCTQDDPKLRPSMSTVIQMLTGEIDVNLKSITKPGIISDFADLKIISHRKAKQRTSTNIMSSTLFTHDNSPLSSENISHASYTFTAISERDG